MISFAKCFFFNFFYVKSWLSFIDTAITIMLSLISTSAPRNALPRVHFSAHHFFQRSTNKKL